MEYNWKARQVFFIYNQRLTLSILIEFDIFKKLVSLIKLCKTLFKCSDNHMHYTLLTFGTHVYYGFF
jgi:hypothetical protein